MIVRKSFERPKKTKPNKRHIKHDTFYLSEYDGEKIAESEQEVLLETHSYKWVQKPYMEYEKIIFLPVGELNPGLPRDRRGYSPLTRMSMLKGLLSFEPIRLQKCWLSNQIEKQKHQGQLKNNQTLPCSCYDMLLKLLSLLDNPVNPTEAQNDCQNKGENILRRS